MLIYQRVNISSSVAWIKSRGPELLNPHGLDPHAWSARAVLFFYLYDGSVHWGIFSAPLRNVCQANWFISPNELEVDPPIDILMFNLYPLNIRIYDFQVHLWFISFISPNLYPLNHAKFSGFLIYHWSRSPGSGGNKWPVGSELPGVNERPISWDMPGIPSGYFT